MHKWGKGLYIVKQVEDAGGYLDRRIIAILAIIAVVIVAAAAILVFALPSSNSNEKVVYFTTVAPKDQAGSIQAGTIAGGVSWEPYSSASIGNGSGKALYWSGDVWPDHPCCVVVVSNSFAEANPDLVARVLRAHIDANNWIADAIAHPGSENYTLLLNMGAQFSNVNTDVVNSSLQHMSLTYQLTPTFYSGIKNFTQDYIDLNQTTTAKMSAAGYASVDDFIGKYVNTSYMDAALNVTPSNGALQDVRMGYLTGDLHQFARLVAENTTVGGGKSLFETYGINEVKPQSGGYANGGAEMQAFGAGSLDMGYLGAPPAILQHINAGVNTKIVAQANTEGSALVVGSGINSFADLNGKKIGDPGVSSIQHLLLLEIAKMNGFQAKSA